MKSSSMERSWRLIENEKRRESLNTDYILRVQTIPSCQCFSSWYRRRWICQVTLVRFFSRAMIQAQVIPAGRLEPFVAKNLFDMSDGTSVEKHLGSGGMPEQVRCNSFFNSGQATVPLEKPPNVGLLEPRATVY